jgi:hypothetical protein
MSIKSKRVGRVPWSLCIPFYYGTYTGITTGGKSCVIEVDTRIRVHVKDSKGKRRQIGSDRIAFWHLREDNIRSLISGLEAI